MARTIRMDTLKRREAQKAARYRRELHRQRREAQRELRAA